MESKISEANSMIDEIYVHFGWTRHVGMAISCNNPINRFNFG